MQATFTQRTCQTANVLASECLQVCKPEKYLIMCCNLNVKYAAEYAAYETHTAKGKRVSFAAVRRLSPLSLSENVKNGHPLV